MQAAHAVYEHARHFPPDPKTEHPHLVLLTVPDGPALETALASLRSVPHAPYREPDAGHQLTAVAAGPVRGAVRSLFRKYPLLKGE